MKKQTIDIKSLTAELKGLHKEGDKKVAASSIGAHSKNLYSDRSKTSVTKGNTKNRVSKQSPSDDLYQIIRNVNAKHHYKVDRFFYVDEDIHELFIKLKAHTRLKISHLVSSLLEDFILEHQAAIKEIISKRQNKFLD